MVKAKNKITLIAFCAILGAVAGIVLWLFLKIVNVGTEFIWEELPELIGDFKYYPLVICSIGGLIIGIFRKFAGDYPEDMMTVIAKTKKEGTYPYQKILILIIAALLPLIFGASIGPEAGMVGIIVALGCWVSENISFAGKNTQKYSKVGMAVSLSVLFHAPLFGFFSAEEDELLYSDESDDAVKLDDDKKIKSKMESILIYSIALASSFGMVTLFNNIFGEVSEGFPSFETSLPKGYDFLMLFVYVIAGSLLGLFFEKSEMFLEKLSEKIPAIVKELIAGVILGLLICFVPAIQFSGEHQMGVLISDYARYAPLALIGLALLKVLITNICIQFGLKGGHFFPLIFAAVALGYGISLLVFPMDGAHAVFAAAVTTAAALGMTMKKPLAVTCLLFLCFPVRMLVWLFLGAAIPAYIFNKNEE